MWESHAQEISEDASTAPLITSSPRIVGSTSDRSFEVEISIPGCSGLRVLVDTGSQISAISRERVDSCGIETIHLEDAIPISGGPGRIVGKIDEFAAGLQVSMAAIDLGEIRAAIVDRSRFRTGRDGILGLDVLRRGVWLFDMPANRIVVLPAKDVERSLERIIARDFRLTRFDVSGRPVPVTQIWHAGVDSAIPMFVDTGAGITALPNSVIEHAGLKPSTYRLRRHFGGEEEVPLFRAQDIRVWGLRIVGLNAARQNWETGILGMDVLGKIRWVYDGPRQTILVVNDRGQN